MPFLVVCSLARVEDVARKHRPARMLSILSEPTPVSRPAGVDADAHLQLTFNDIGADVPGLVSPAAGHVSAMLDFARDWDRAAPLLVHCFAGVSRSTASAYAIALALDPARDAAQTAHDLRLRSPTASPNRRLVAIADELLDRQGRMTTAIDGIGRGADCFEGAPFIFPVDDDYADHF